MYVGTLIGPCILGGKYLTGHGWMTFDVVGRVNPGLVTTRGGYCGEIMEWAILSGRG